MPDDSSAWFSAALVGGKSVSVDGKSGSVGEKKVEAFKKLAKCSSVEANFLSATGSAYQKSRLFYFSAPYFL